MVNGFEQETKELDSFEQEASKIVKDHILTLSLDCAVKSKDIADVLWKRGYIIGPARIRKVIHHLRVTHQVENLIATSHGYYRTADPDKIKKYMQSLTQRSNAIMEVRDSFLLTNSTTTNPN